jgi:hypothetical protein
MEDEEAGRSERTRVRKGVVGEEKEDWRMKGENIPINFDQFAPPGISAYFSIKQPGQVFFFQ